MNSPIKTSVVIPSVGSQRNLSLSSKELALLFDYFKLNPCNYCDDVFAELADVVFMDAWLPKYSKDPLGHSLVINRNKAFTFIFNQISKSQDIYLTASCFQVSEENGLKMLRF